MPRKTSAATRARPRRKNFNEAAARCRGKHVFGDRLAFCAFTSMRPRLDAAENARAPAAQRPAPRHFNEAAARCRGKPRGGRAAPRRARRLTSMRPRLDAAENRPPAGRSFRTLPPYFNEAAARCRGKQVRRPRHLPRRQTSMRPRLDAAENDRQRARLFRSVSTSMRPRLDAAENQEAGSARRPTLVLQ